MYGAAGGQLHQDIVEWTIDLQGTVRKLFDWMEWYFVYQGSLAATLLGTLGGGEGKNHKKDGYYPDGLWMWEDLETGESGAFAIEVGRFELDRHPYHIPTLHIGFDGKVSLVDMDPTDWEVGEAVRVLIYFLWDCRDCQGTKDCDWCVKRATTTIGYTTSTEV